MTVTGERISTAQAGFNPTFQRHVAAYRACAHLLPDGLVLDLGCGTGHSYRELDPRVTVGVDIESSVLVGQSRQTHSADMRTLPFGPGHFDAVACVQAIEHVPDPERVLHEVARVLKPSGRAVFVTPNRLTFGRRDEIIDPYHYVEYDSEQLRQICLTAFPSVNILGLFGSERYRAIVGEERQQLDRILALDPLRLRRALPRPVRRRLYDWGLSRSRAAPVPGAGEIGPADFSIAEEPLATALDLVALCDLA